MDDPVPGYVCDGSCSSVLNRNFRNHRFYRKSTLMHHMKLYHKAQISDPTNNNTAKADTVGDSMEIDFSNPFGECLDDNDNVPDPFLDNAGDCTPPNEVTEQKFIKAHLNEYLQMVKVNGFFPAVSCLVCRAAFSCEHTGSQQAILGQIPAAWIRLFWNIAVLVTGMSKSSQLVLSEVITFVLTFVPKGVQRFVPIPSSLPDFLSKIKNRTNTNSFHSILPIPHCDFNHDTEHSFSKITEIIPHAMLLPPVTSLTEIHPRYKSVVNSTLFKERRSKIAGLSSSKGVVVMAFVPLWSDGWDPSSSNKGNRYPVWTATGTIVFVEPGECDQPYLVVTQLLASGPGKADHNDFFEPLA